MRVLVCGGRDFRDRLSVVQQLDAIKLDCRHDCLTIIQGGATGADELARDWCYARCIPYLNYPANWHRDGRAAGPIRNQRMIDNESPNLVVAFPGGRGTDDMIRRAEMAGIQVIRVPPRSD